MLAVSSGVGLSVEIAAKRLWVLGDGWKRSRLHMWGRRLFVTMIEKRMCVVGGDYFVV